ncbi:hypothetical protein [Cryobacterium sp. PH31-O1]|uniref:TY-Chap2 family putative peptide chaperone n=1 Tax=Cryobacterium sp. PH31-O1 TaxID=3046306 RepID=UPI0024B98A6D|nr:hypothetical protein [Cryobacterium sp. PH31-O1]MDJ0337365.1 hypothetical protein [Cryobacterium sp. PH31-O1]
MSNSASRNSGNNFATGNDAGGDVGEEYYPPADRFLTAQIWWIASELVRRHPQLRIAGVEVDEGDRLIIVHDEHGDLSIQWDLVGGCQYLVNGLVHVISWIEMMAAFSPHGTLKRLEEATGLGIPTTAPATTPRTLAYRVITKALVGAVNDRHEWYAVTAPMLVEQPTHYFNGFPTAVLARSAYEVVAEQQVNNAGTVYFFQPFWVLLRDLEPIAIFDVAGVVHTSSGATSLLPVYEELDHNLTLTTARVLGRYLA